MPWMKHEKATKNRDATVKAATRLDRFKPTPARCCAPYPQKTAVENTPNNARTGARPSIPSETGTAGTKCLRQIDQKKQPNLEHLVVDSEQLAGLHEGAHLRPEGLRGFGVSRPGDPSVGSARDKKITQGGIRGRDHSNSDFHLG